MPLVQVQQFAGHRDIKITMGYVHTLVTDLSRTMVHVDSKHMTESGQKKTAWAKTRKGSPSRCRRLVTTLCLERTRTWLVKRIVKYTREDSNL